MAENMDKLDVALFTLGLFAVLLIVVMINPGSINQPEKRQIKEVTFKGSIDPDYTYAMRVTYASSLDTGACTSWSLFEGRSKKI
jgi:hypothetical protein